MAEFCSARSETIPPLPWTNFAPPFPPEEVEEAKRREKERAFALNQTIADIVDERLGEIQMLSSDFEGASGVSRSQGVKKGKAIAALDYLDGISTGDLPAVLKEPVQEAYK